MPEQEFPQLPLDQRWEYATLTSNRTAGFFGTIGAKQSLIWSSTLDDEGEINFEQSTPDLLYRLGRAGWELVSSTTATNIRGGTTHELVMVFVFKQRVATTEDHALAQLIDPAALLKRANRYMQQQNMSMAMKALNRALSLSPQQLDMCYLARGRVYLSLGNEERAIEDFDKAIQANQQCGEAHMERGNIYFRHNDYEKAIYEYNGALVCIRDDYGGPNSRLITETRYNRGLAYSGVGKAKDAMKDLKEYLNRAQLGPNERSEIEGWIKEQERRK